MPYYPTTVISINEGSVRDQNVKLSQYCRSPPSTNLSACIQLIQQFLIHYIFTSTFIRERIGWLKVRIYGRMAM